MTIQELIARQQAIVSGARAAGRDLTAEERAEFDGLQRQIDAAGNNPPAQGNEGQGGEDPTGGARGMGNDNGQQGTDPTEAARQAVATERQRVSDITALCRQAGMDPAEYISNGATMDTVRQAAVDYLLKHGAPVSSRMNGDEGDNFRQAAVDAMLLRTGVNVQNPAKGAEEMRGYSLRDLAIECMARDGVGTTTSLLRMSKDDLWNEACRQFFNPTAAFPAILDNAIRKNIVQMYQEIPTTFQLWTTKGSVSDFKPTKDHSYLAGGAGEFLRVGENGELKADTPKTELLPQRQIDTFGRQFSMTRQAFINDDVGFITEMPGLYAMSAKRTINKQVYKILIDNPAIFDGVSLFDNAHNNLIASGAAPSIDTLQGFVCQGLRLCSHFLVSHHVGNGRRKQLFDGEAFRAAPLHNGGVPGSERGNKRFQAARLQRFHGPAVQDLCRRRGCVRVRLRHKVHNVPHGTFSQHGGLQGGGAGGKDFAF